AAFAGLSMNCDAEYCSYASYALLDADHTLCRMLPETGIYCRRVVYVITAYKLAYEYDFSRKEAFRPAFLGAFAARRGGAPRSLGSWAEIRLISRNFANSLLREGFRENRYYSAQLP